MIITKQFDVAFDEICIARKHLHDATENEIICKDALKSKEADLLMSGAIIGKNAESRQAQLVEMTKTEIDSLKAAEMETRLARLELEQAIDFRRCLESCLEVEKLGMEA